MADTSSAATEKKVG